MSISYKQFMPHLAFLVILTGIISCHTITKGIKDIEDIEVIKPKPIGSTVLEERGTVHENKGTIYLLPAQAVEKVASDLDAIIKKLPEGQIAYNIPSTMFVGERSFVKVNLTKDLSADISREFGSEVKIERLKLNTFMKIDLIGDDFEIKPVTETSQIINNSSVFQWEWIVLPKQSGIKELILKVSARLKMSDATQEPYTLKTIRTSVKVENNPQYFLGQNWKWFVEIGVALGFGGIIGSTIKPLKNFIVRKVKSSSGSSGSGSSKP
jgi:hypothetical protein